MADLIVSNIAWTNDEEPEVAKLLAQINIRGVEVAPTKIWQDPTSISSKDIEDNLEFWQSNNLDLVAFQSMLFGRENLQIFNDQKTTQETFEFLSRFIVLAGKMGAGIMVFGSPKNRLVAGVDKRSGRIIALDFFKNLGEIAEENNTIFCIEPNPTDYGCDFITTAEEGIDFVTQINSPGLGLHLDIAGMTLSGDNISESIKNASGVLKHFHISEPFLGKVESKTKVEHKFASDALKEINYQGYVSIEMRPGANGENVSRVREAVGFAKIAYSSLLG